jgi:hypothetical protein
MCHPSAPWVSEGLLLALDPEGDEMIFEDPIRTISVELPAGWSYDPFTSSLTDFIFSHWACPEVLLIVHVRRSEITESRPDKEWIEQIRNESDKAISLDDMMSNHGRAIAATFESKGGLVQRVAFIRGANVELAVEQRGSEPGSKNPYAPLEKAVLTVSSGANGKLPESGGRVEFNQSIEKANLAFDKKDFPNVADALGEAVRIGVYTWLRSLSSPDNVPEISAAVRAAQTMAQLGRFLGNPFFLRDAEFVLRRAQRSIQDAGAAEGMQSLQSEISEIIESIISELLKQAEPSEEEISPILASRERGFRFSQAAAKAFEAGDFKNASMMADAGVEGLLSLIAFLRHSRSYEIPSEIVAQLASQGITDLDSQRDAIQKAREAVLLPPLNLALQVRYCSALEQSDIPGAVEAATVLVPVAQLALDSFQGDAGPSLSLVLALMDRAASLVMAPDKNELGVAADCLEKASEMLESFDAKRTGEDIWVRYHNHQIEGLRQTVADAVEAADKGGSADLKEQLQKIQTMMEKVAESFRKAHARYTG